MAERSHLDRAALMACPLDSGSCRTGSGFLRNHAHVWVSVARPDMVHISEEVRFACPTMRFARFSAPTANRSPSWSTRTLRR
jgi:hypothetical protein